MYNIKKKVEPKVSAREYVRNLIGATRIPVSDEEPVVRQLTREQEQARRAYVRRVVDNARRLSLELEK